MADQKEDSVGGNSQIIMKVDAPPEEKNMIASQENAENKLESKGESVANNTSVKPKTTPLVFNNSSTFSLRSSILSQPRTSGFVLRPSALGAKIDNKTEPKSNPFALNPTRLNPFAKQDTNEETENCIPKKDTNGSSEISSNSQTDGPKFMPLSATEAAKQSSSTGNVASNPNFVFGQNLHERIVAEKESSSETNSVAGPSHANANGTSELLFTNAVKNSAPASKEVKTLTESAREYEESRANKRKYEQVTVVTGEEDEKNVLQINCKLFAFDKSSGNWQERGRGTLRLNDKEVTSEQESFIQSRLVIRTTGSLRVVLNTKIWAEMTIDLASPKSLRLTAMDGTGLIKVFLIMANPEEIKQLHRLLEVRVNNEIERHRNMPREPEFKKPAVETSD